MKLDLSDKNLRKLDFSILKQLLETIDLKDENGQKMEDLENAIQTIVINNNFLSKLENLEKFVNLKNLSMANNRLVEIRQISKLLNLEYLNLLNNSLSSLDCFKQLKNLRWLNVSGNQIKNLDCLKFNIHLITVDASDNSISVLSDLSALKELTTLNLNGNEISTLKNAPNFLPKSLKNLFLSYNSIDDLNEVSYLESLVDLENFSIESNPCVAYSNGLNMLNYRPFVLNWCINLKQLDDNTVTQKEFLKAEWLYSQGKGRHFRPGQHVILIDYLIKHCPALSNESIEEDIRLSKILEKKETYLTELETQAPNPSTSPKRSKLQNLKVEPASQLPPSSQVDLAPINEHKTIIDDIKFSSNESISNLANKMDTELTDSEKNLNNRYIDYDNRPIKPLDANFLNKQLSEYSEISSEELEKMKEQVVKRTRAKTADNVIKFPQQPKLNSKTPVRQLSFNSSNPQQQIQLSSKHQPIIQSNRLGKFRKRSKTQDELSPTKNPNLNSIFQSNKLQAKALSPIKVNSPNKINAPKKSSNVTPTRSKQLKYNSEYYSPRSNKLGSPNSKKTTTNVPIRAGSPTKKVSSANPTPASSKRVTLFKELSKHSSNELENDDLNSQKVTLVSSKSPSSEEESTKVSTLQHSITFSGVTTNTNTLNTSGKVSLIDQLQHLEIHQKIQTKRNEMRLVREKNLREIKNELKQLDQQKEISQFENICSKTVIPTKNLTFEDRCAIKIQAAWRGYYYRKSKFIKPILLKLKYKKLQNQVTFLRFNLDSIKKQQFDLVKLNKEITSKCINMVKILAKSSNDPKSDKSDEFDFHSRIQPLPMTYNEQNDTRTSQLEKENNDLKLKYKQLEDKCRNLEQKIVRQKENYQKSGDFSNTSNNNNTSRLSDTTNTSKSNKNVIETGGNSHMIQQPKLEIHPPLRVRLQKLNEKSVALKWNHNPKNVLVELTGYNVYINEDLLATMRPNDKIASIDGMKEEGEYRIYIKSVCGQIESDISNTVITRVKKKPSTLTSTNENEETRGKRKENNLSDRRLEFSSESDEDSNSATDSPEIVEGLKLSDEKRDSIEKILEKLKSTDINPQSPILQTNPIKNRQNVASRFFANSHFDSKHPNLAANISSESIKTEVSSNAPLPFQSKIESSTSFTVNQPIKTAAQQINTSSSSNSSASKSPRKSSKPPISPGSTAKHNTDFEVASVLAKPNARSHSFKQTTSPTNNYAPHSLFDFVENAKYSNSEPNLTKTQSSASGSTGRASLVRQSMSFSDSNDESKN